MAWLDRVASSPWAVVTLLAVIVGAGWAIERWERGE